MNRILIALLILLPFAAVKAQPVSHAMLKLRLSDGAPLSVNIDGQFISRNTSILRLDGISAGRHKVEVYRDRPKNRKPKRIFTGTINLEPGTVYIGLVDLNSQRLRMKTRAYDPVRDGGGGAAAPGASASDPDMAGAAAGNGFGSFPEGRDNKPAPPDFSATAVPAGIIPAARLTTLEKQVMAKPTEGERLAILKTNLANDKVSVAQVDKLFSWLSFESSRLELLDWIKSRVADPANLSMLEYRFSLDENRAAFRKRIGK